MTFMKNISRESLFGAITNVILVFMVFLLPDILWDVRDDSILQVCIMCGQSRFFWCFISTISLSFQRC